MTMNQEKVNIFKIGIPPHIDVHSPFKEIFVSLSLSSGCVMTFQNAYDLQN